MAPATSKGFRMGMKLWYVNVEGFKVEAETYDEAWGKAYDEAASRAILNEYPEPTDVTICEEEYCSECLESTCKDNPNA